MNLTVKKEIAMLVVGAIILIPIVGVMVKSWRRPRDTIAEHLRKYSELARQQPTEQTLEQLRDFWYKRHWQFTAEQEVQWRDLCYFIERCLHHKIKR